MTTDLDIERLIAIVADGIRKLRTLEGVPVTDEQCQERARNIVTQIIVDYEVRRLPEVRETSAPEWWSSLIAGRPIGHSWSCKCDRCADYNQITGRKS